MRSPATLLVYLHVLIPIAHSTVYIIAGGIKTHNCYDIPAEPHNISK